MELQQLIKRIEELRQEYAAYQPLPQEAQEKLNKKFRLEFNYNSNHIEGNTLTYGETQLLLFFGKTEGQHDIREYEEMKGSDIALKMAQEHAADKERTLTEEFIKNLNKIILVRPYWANAITPDGQPTRREISIGDYKKHYNSVKLQSGEMFHYAKPEETPMKMGELIAWYREESEKNELHPIALAALLHYKFVLIHPFDDGNGRISRLLMNYVLYCHNLPPVIIKSANKKDYLFALNQADTGNINAFVEYVAEQLLWSLDIAIKAAKGERIEEQDDLEKEISVWKRELQGKSTKETALKSGLIIGKICDSYINPLVRFFGRKMEVFKDIFTEWEQTSTINGTRIDENSYFDPSSVFIREATHLSCGIRMNGYKINLKNSQTIDARIYVEFNNYNYTITIVSPGPTKEIVKAYDEALTPQQQSDIVNDVVKNVFAYIKSQTEERPQ